MAPAATAVRLRGRERGGGGWHTVVTSGSGCSLPPLKHTIYNHSPITRTCRHTTAGEPNARRTANDFNYSSLSREAVLASRLGAASKQLLTATSLPQFIRAALEHVTQHSSELQQLAEPDRAKAEHGCVRHCGCAGQGYVVFVVVVVVVQRGQSKAAGFEVKGMDRPLC